MKISTIIVEIPAWTHLEYTNLSLGKMLTWKE